mmetsp:Transcript_21571/g.48012  ORF Transcript_21571/g.48012 Transcript_21571/m.48012 type:complete len:291 (+) Transcript_21571:495-1367(+)
MAPPRVGPQAFHSRLRGRARSVPGTASRRPAQLPLLELPPIPGGRGGADPPAGIAVQSGEDPRKLLQLLRLPPPQHIHQGQRAGYKGAAACGAEHRGERVLHRAGRSECLVVPPVPAELGVPRSLLCLYLSISPYLSISLYFSLYLSFYLGICLHFCLRLHPGLYSILYFGGRRYEHERKHGRRHRHEGLGGLVRARTAGTAGAGAKSARGGGGLPMGAGLPRAHPADAHSNSGAAGGARSAGARAGAGRGRAGAGRKRGRASGGETRSAGAPAGGGSGPRQQVQVRARG